MKRNNMTFLLLAAITGFYTYFSESWTWFYKVNLFVHPVVALIAAILFYRFVGRVAFSNDSAAIWRGAILPGLAIAVPLLFLISRRPSFVWELALVVAYPILTRRVLYTDPPVFLTRCAAFYFTALTITGVFFAVGLGGRSVSAILLTHRYLAFAFLITFAASRLLALRKKRSVWSDREEDRLSRSGLAAGTLALVVYLCAIFVSDILQKEDRPWYKFHLSAYTLEDRTETERDIVADFDEPRLATKTDSCGGASGCHQNLIDDVATSIHGVSLRTSYIQKHLQLLADEIGPHNQHTCAGCHYPRALFERDVTIANGYSEVNFSCTFCHQISDVFVGHDDRRTAVAVELHVDHLRMFDRNRGDAISDFDRFLIELNPFGHGRVFARELYKEDRYCQSCHVQLIKPTPETNLSKPGCIDCHMQARELIGMEGDTRNHIFPGSGQSVAADLRLDSLSLLNRRFTQGLLPLPLKGWGSFWEPRDHASGHMVWLSQKAMPVFEPVPGEEFRLRIITTNASIDHRFPGGSLDLIDVWQKVVVTDNHGRELLRVGDLDAHGKVDPAAHRLGGHVLDYYGQRLELYRIWHAKEDVVERALEFNHHTQDEYTFYLPEDSDYIEIDSAWHYRDLNHEFATWAYGEGGAAQGMVVDRMTGRIPVR